MNARREVEFLLLGGGMASANCAAELRRRGADGEIVLVGREPHPPYERPPLSKEYMRAESSVEDAYVHPEEWYDENGVELRTGTNVMSLDAERRVARLLPREEIGFEKALVATGADVRILRVDGAELDGIHYLRTYKTSDEIQADAAGADHVVLVGGSYIATEVAASLTAKGKRCTLVMAEEVALSRTFGAEVGRHFHELLESRGVGIVGGEEVDAFVGEGRVGGVRTKSGRVIEGDVVVVGAGVHPDERLAGKAGLKVEDGIVCDERLESSVEGIYAAGDVCSYRSVVHGRRLRIEHWDVALQQGQYAARAMLGERAPYDAVPYFFSDLADWVSYEYLGPAERWDEIVWRGDRDGGEFTAWYLDGGKVVAALTVGRSRDLMHARRLIESGADVSDQRDALADVDTDLGDVGT